MNIVARDSSFLLDFLVSCFLLYFLRYKKKDIKEIDDASLFFFLGLVNISPQLNEGIQRQVRADQELYIDEDRSCVFLLRTLKRNISFKKCIFIPLAHQIALLEITVDEDHYKS